MGVVVGNIIKVNGKTVGRVDECKCSVPQVFNADFERPAVYVIERRCHHV